MVNQHTHPEKRRGTEGETRQRRRRRGRRRRREKRRRRERDVASNTRTLTLGHHPRSGRGKPAHAPQEGDEEGGEEEEKGAWPVTHAPQHWDTTPGQEVVNQHTHPKKGTKKEEKKKRKGRGQLRVLLATPLSLLLLLTHAPQHWDTTPGQDVVNQHTHPKKRRGTKKKGRNKRQHNSSTIPNPFF